jgi:hypothetical protein
VLGFGIAGGYLVILLRVVEQDAKASESLDGLQRSAEGRAACGALYRVRNWFGTTWHYSSRDWKQVSERAT